jgi:hypothetical protein
MDRVHDVLPHTAPLAAIGGILRRASAVCDNLPYTAWLPFFKCENCTGFLSDWDAPGFGNELYDHSDAPVPTSYLMETVNIAGQVEVKDIEEALRAELKAWTLSGM